MDRGVVYKHMYPTCVCQEGLEATMLRSNKHSALRSWFINITLHERVGLLGKGLTQEKYKMHLNYAIVPKSKGVLQKFGGHVEKTQ